MCAKILVIDDSPFISKTVRKAVEPEGFQVVGQAFTEKNLEIRSLKVSLIRCNGGIRMKIGVEVV